MKNSEEHSFPNLWNAYLINLPERKDRLALAERELARVRWSFGPGQVTLFPALKFSDRGNFPSVGARGAFYSHAKCLEAGSKDELRHLLLLEDDVSFASCLPNLLPLVIKILEQTDWDFCYLGHEATGPIPRANAQTHDIVLAPYNGDIIGLHFCLINVRIINRLLVHINRVASGVEGDQVFGPMPIDGAFNIFRRVNSDVKTLLAIPKLGWQRPSRSDISPKRFDHWRYGRTIASSLRYVKYLISRSRA